VVWSDGIFGKFNKINFSAWIKTWVDLFIMLIVVCMDNALIGLTTTENKLPVKIDKDYEVQLHGKGNLLIALCGSSVGYMQFEFNVINFGVLGNSKDRRAGMFCAFFCGMCFFLTVEHFNLLPRVFLSTLLFFAGSGFIAENLWGSRFYLGKDEWVQVLLVLAVFVVSGSLLYAVIAGGMMVGLSFVIRYSKVPCTAGPLVRGSDILSCERRFTPLQVTVKHISRQWLLVVRLRGFVFFASVTRLVEYLHHELDAHEVKDEEWMRLRFIIFDLEVLDAMDSSAAKAMQKFMKDVKEKHVRCLFSSVDEHHEKRMRRTGSLGPNEAVYADLDEAVLYVEHQILEYRHQLQERWRSLSFAFSLGQHLACEHMQFEPFEEVLASMDAQFVGRWDYCAKIRIEAYKSLLWKPGEDGRELYLIHSGAVALFEKLPTKHAEQDPQDFTPVAVYRHGWFLNREALMRVPTRFFAVAVEDGELVCWSRHHFERMVTEAPWMADRILEESMAQAQTDVERTADDLKHAMEEDDPHADLGVADWENTRSSLAMLTFSVNEVKRMSRVLQAATGPAGVLQIAQDKIEGLLPACPGVKGALFLEHHGFYEVPEGAGYLPALPQHIHDSLKQAFLTYQVVEAKGPVLPWALVKDALKFAGVFDIILANVTRGPLTQDEFIDLGHEAAFARLSPKQIEAAHAIYDDLDENHDGSLSFIEAISQLLKLFTTRPLTHDAIKHMAEPWAAGESSFTKQSIVQLMSRYVRRFAIYWLMLDTLRDIFDLPQSRSEFKTDQPLSQSVLAEKVFQPQVLEKLGTTEHELAELLWASGCCGHKSPYEMLSFDFQSLVQAAMLHVGKVQTSLPIFPTRFIVDLTPQPPQDLNDSDKPRRDVNRGSIGDLLDGNGPPADGDDGERLVGRGSEGSLDNSGSQKVTKKFKRQSKLAPRESVKRIGTFGSCFGGIQTSTPDPPVASDIRPPETNTPSPDVVSLKDIIVDFRTLSKYNAKKRPSREDVISTCLKGHTLVPQKVQESAQGKSVFRCGRCTQQAAVGQVVYCCSACEYYVCEGCRKATEPQLAYVLESVVPSQISSLPLDTKRKRMTEHFGPRQQEDTFTFSHQDTETITGLRARIYYTFERPDNSWLGKNIANFMSFIIILNLFTMIFKPLVCAPHKPCQEDLIWQLFEGIFATFFTIEYVTRLCVCNALTNSSREVFKFLRSPTNTCDLLSVVPFYFSLVSSQKGGAASSVLKVARLFKLTRIMGAMRLAKRVPAKFSNIVPPILVLFLVIWGIYMKEVEFGKASKK